MIKPFSFFVVFATILMLFTIGAKISLSTAREFSFKEAPTQRKKNLTQKMPLAILSFFLGFTIIFYFLIESWIVIVTSSITSSLLLTLFIVSSKIPELKRKPPCSK